MRRLLALACFAPPLLTGAAAAQEPMARSSVETSCERRISEDVVASVSGRGELLLASGRTIKLLDIRLPPEDEELGRALAWLRLPAGRRIAVASVGAADRWNRIAADVSLLDETPRVDLAERLVDDGHAMVDAGERRVLCRPNLLAREERARADRRGLWASGLHEPVAAADEARLRQRVGRFALVEGMVRSVGERPERTYLNFGPDWTRDLTITIPKRTWAMMTERGLSATALRGRRVRARGLLEGWQGVAVEITAPDMLEMLGQELRRP
jgi:endonuclease YncB( thermonuclease family)